jgi:hypothetical protein
MSPAVAALRRDKHGRVIPWFVACAEDGTPDHRVVRTSALRDAIRFDLCWICGQHRGSWGTFVIGPAAAVTRIAPEPPCHRGCAAYAPLACPHLRTPEMQRRDRNLPEDRTTPGGTMLLHNPGVTALWTTRRWRVLRADGVVFELGEPSEVKWYHRGRPATRAEVLESIDTGMPALLADAQKRGSRAVAQLERERQSIPLLPAA